MAASQTPRTTTVSTCTPETALGTCVFQINRYSLHKGLGVGKSIPSSTFAVGGYDWCIHYYPDGAVAEVSKEYLSVSLQLLTENAEVRAVYDFSLAIPGTTDSRELVFSSEKPFVFNGARPTLFTRKFKKRSELEASPFLRDDRIVIVCDVTVIKKIVVVEETALAFQVPPSDLSDRFSKLLETKNGADVTFKVKGVPIRAHKIVLAAGSPVFDEALQKQKRGRDITIDDMQPAVFKALLHFIYTDSLPSMKDLAGDKHRERQMVKDLFVAADKYAMKRMKMMCAAMLCQSLDVETVATTFALAHKHDCSELKDACVRFITSSNRMDDVVASQGYVDLNRSCLRILAEMLEKVSLAK